MRNALLRRPAAKGRLVLAVAASIGASAALFAQAVANVSPAPASVPTAAGSGVPVVQLAMDTLQPVNWGSGSVLVASPFQCASDGGIFAFGAVVPADFGTVAGPPVFNASLYDYQSETKTLIFDPAQSGLKNIQAMGKSFTVDDSGVIFLADAVTSQELMDDKKAKNHPFLVFFDRKGEFQRYVPVERPTAPRQIALLSSGEILVVGVEAANPLKEEWDVLDEDGTYQRSLTPYLRDEADDEAEQIALGGGLPPNLVLFPHEGSILGVELNSTRPVLEINERGIVRSTQLQLPKGFKIANWIGSQERNLMMLMVKPFTNAEGKADPYKGWATLEIGEFDPASGDLVRIYKLDDPSHRYDGYGLGCYRDGVFRGFVKDPKTGSTAYVTAAPAR